MAEMSASLEDLIADSPHHIPVFCSHKNQNNLGGWQLTTAN